MMLIQLFLSGISQGGVYALVALGMTLLFRCTTVVNFAQGDMLMAGAFSLYVFMHLFNGNYALAALCSLVVLGVMSVGINILFIEPMARAPHTSVVMMTVAVSFMLRGIARIFWGRDVISMPAVFSYPPVTLGDIVWTTQDIVITLAALVIVGAFLLFFYRSKPGRLAQAVSQNGRGAAMVGVDVVGFNRMIWGVTGMMAAASGILIAPITLLYPDMGAGVLIKAFAAMALGGFGTVGGAVLGGFLLGILEQLSGGYVSTGMIDICAYLVIIFVLTVKPSGLLGRKEFARV
ncbi:branched-chain amino acid ABC transporter permease [Paraburkholderia fynbosensis]|uniref:High-affinity branched-chain amino acid transport system permease protein LivH n=1 Tax=Paraburkholderia fynbosensis TaxID=1200993 RepID=A0A6J5GV30_9BURK|nr:branched-chain amino acid ABC transporter permease [Paraburkholderia fynbosensis]CAB3804252.1 High-affinity branched-chain amino acid transport system permease protein LivH [Paraburkholderia fynbosensis]